MAMLMLGGLAGAVGCSGAPGSEPGEGPGEEALGDGAVAVDASDGGTTPERPSADATAGDDGGAGDGSDEVCDDGLDDDGDGEVDEGCGCRPGRRTSCYTGSESSRGVGACADGAMECEGFEFGEWGACEGDVLPDEEMCDGELDEDCDGAVDEGCDCRDGDSRSCGSETGECVSGTQHCTDGSWGGCEAAEPPETETCDALDNDCDGVVDEELSRRCGTDEGACMRGWRRCTEGEWGECEGAGEPSEEVCDGLDNDCDGVVDEGLVRDCGSDVGECEAGTRSCDSGVWAECTGAIGPMDEACDGLDDDCDGTVDEGCDCTDGETRSCGSDVGECIAGSQGCRDGAWESCSGAVGPSDEVCDGLDNDCDGVIDEELVRSCGSDVGECSLGTESCTDGSWGSCTGGTGPSAETCDGLDNDCDSVVDEGLVRSCGSDVGECETGTQSCGGGLWGECSSVEPTAETCDALDNDCDAIVDEGACATFEEVLEQQRDLDLLFVMDNSGTMEDEQASLADHYDALITELESIEGGLPNLHLGVVSTDMGAGPYSIVNCEISDEGILQNEPRVTDCSPPEDRYILDIDDGAGGRIRNYSGTLQDTFSCIAQLGTDGCGFEQPLEAMTRALDGSNPENEGFLREDAFLGVVFLTDEDDCSAYDTAIYNPDDDSFGTLSSFRCTEYGVMCDGAPPDAPGSYTACEPRSPREYIEHPDPYVSFLRSLKADEDHILTAAIAGPESPFEVTDSSGRLELEPSCSSASGEADPAVRLQYFLDQFPGRSAFTPICEADLSGALSLIGDSIATAMSTQCLPERPLDEDPSTAGLQAACTMADVRDYGTASETAVAAIAECAEASDTEPCYEIIEESANCPSDPRLEVRLHRRGTTPPEDTVPVIRCEWPG